MQITKRLVYDVTVLDLKETVHCGDCYRELEAIINYLTSLGCVRLLIYLSEVTHIDTMCLFFLIAAQLRFQRRRGVLNLLQTPPLIQHMLSIAIIYQFLPTFIA